MWDLAWNLIFTRDNSSYREQKPSIRPLYPTLQAHHSNTNPCSPFPRRGLHHAVDHDGGPAAFVEAPAAAGDPHHPVVGHPDPCRRRARCTDGAIGICSRRAREYFGNAPGRSLVEAGRRVGRARESSAIAPPSPYQIGSLDKRRERAWPAAIALPSPSPGKKRAAGNSGNAGSPAAIRTR